MGRETKFKGAVVPGVFAQNAEFFSSDIKSGARFDRGSTKIIITLQITTAKKIQATIDGVLFGYLNGGNVVPAASIFELGIRVKHGSLFNLRTDDAAGVTVSFCDIHEDSR